MNLYSHIEKIIYQSYKEHVKDKLTKTYKRGPGHKASNNTDTAIDTDKTTQPRKKISQHSF